MGVCACCRRAQGMISSDAGDGANLQAALLANTERHIGQQCTEISGDDFDIAGEPLQHVGHGNRYYWVTLKPGKEPPGKSAHYFIAKTKHEKKNKEREQVKEPKKARQQAKHDDSQPSTEIWFYEQAAKYRQGRARSLHAGSWEILNWTLDYRGVYRAPAVRDEQTGRKGERRKYLLLQNLFEGADPQLLRLLQVKLGTTTALSGLTGKDSLEALRSKAADSQTNSQVEGFRVEAFLSPPVNLETLVSTATRDILHLPGHKGGAATPGEEPSTLARAGTSTEAESDSLALDSSFPQRAMSPHSLMSGGSTTCAVSKKVMRQALQRLQAHEFISLWMQPPCDAETCMLRGEPNLAQDVLTPCEVAAAALRGVVRNLLSMLSAASTVMPPQQWVSSSVALAYDLDAQLPRDKSVQEYDPLKDAAASVARVHLFGWDRSEFTTMEIFNSLTKQQREDRAHHWARWVAGVLRLAFEAARAYRRTYCPANGNFQKVRVRVWSVSRSVHLLRSVTKGHIIGEHVCNLEEMDHKWIELKPPQRSLVSHVGSAIDVRQWHIKAYGAARTGVNWTAAHVPGKKDSKAGTNNPRVELSIRGPWRYPKGSALRERWEVHVHGAQSLPKTETIEWCNPVVSVSLLDHMGAGAEYHSACEHAQKAPKWDECFMFNVATYPARLKGALVPQDIVQSLPASWPEDIASWDLAAGTDDQAHALHQALKVFKEAFFRPTKDRRRRATMVGSTRELNATMAAVGDASLAIAQQLSGDLTDAGQLRQQLARTEERLQARIKELEAENEALRKCPAFPGPRGRSGGAAAQRSPAPEGARPSLDPRRLAQAIKRTAMEMQEKEEQSAAQNGGSASRPGTLSFRRKPPQPLKMGSDTVGAAAPAAPPPSGKRPAEPPGQFLLVSPLEGTPSPLAMPGRPGATPATQLRQPAAAGAAILGGAVSEKFEL
eukprot:TRINITY_DN5621_c0_g1_i1.p1 TRINITY_DN5621_c0_g1~~TRINITY_DN5621_c0_g1_i1.p1  ORF type:complete len:946 (+),score=235.00 TRINITY_DN5621_c0_g1_i1:112-2949(+)